MLELRILSAAITNIVYGTPKPLAPGYICVGGALNLFKSTYTYMRDTNDYSYIIAQYPAQFAQLAELFTTIEGRLNISAVKSIVSGISIADRTSLIDAANQTVNK
jgi:hypothetical protein